mmetsp:Transcript_86512/g.231892  ORF Transcript_86512/g.231892 Transcript_86512/m.231892 type:complete len:325 (+) Transcript_86512:955-1929(+)
MHVEVAAGVVGHGHTQGQAAAGSEQGLNPCRPPRAQTPAKIPSTSQKQHQANSSCGLRTQATKQRSVQVHPGGPAGSGEDFTVGAHVQQGCQGEKVPPRDPVAGSVPAEHEQLGHGYTESPRQKVNPDKPSSQQRRSLPLRHLQADVFRNPPGAQQAHSRQARPVTAREEQDDKCAELHRDHAAFAQVADVTPLQAGPPEVRRGQNTEAESLAKPPHTITAAEIDVQAKPLRFSLHPRVLGHVLPARRNPDPGGCALPHGHHNPQERQLSAELVPCHSQPPAPRQATPQAVVEAKYCRRRQQLVGGPLQHLVSSCSLHLPVLSM